MPSKACASWNANCLGQSSPHRRSGARRSRGHGCAFCFERARRIDVVQDRAAQMKHSVREVLYGTTAEETIPALLGEWQQLATWAHAAASIRAYEVPGSTSR